MNAASTSSQSHSNRHGSQNAFPDAPAAAPLETAGGVEVLAMWDGTVQQVEYLSGARAVYRVSAEPGADCTVPASALPAGGAWPLVQGTAGGDLVICFPETAEGEIVTGPESQPVATSLAALRASGRAAPAPLGGHALALAAGSRVQIVLGPCTFVVQPTAAPPKVPASLAGGDPRSHLANGLSLGAHLVFIALVLSIAPDAHSLNADAFDADKRYLTTIFRPLEKPAEKVPAWLEKKKLGPSESGKSAKRHSGPEGKLGRPGAPKENNRYAIKGMKDSEIVLARARADEAMKRVGFLGIFAARTGGLITADRGGERSIGRDELDALGHLTGDKVGWADGSDGRGLIGGGRGGGGDCKEGEDCDRAIGLDDDGPHTIGTRGPGDGDGIGDGCKKMYGCGAARFDAHKAKVPDAVTAGTPIVRGSLDMDTIRRVIRKHLPEIKYCYDSELVKDTDLHGKVKVAFVISPSGAVAKSGVESSTVANGGLEKCVVEKVSRMVFPAPTGGGIVEVGYPFVFHAPSSGAAR